MAGRGGSRAQDEGVIEGMVGAGQGRGLALLILHILPPSPPTSPTPDHRKKRTKSV